MYYMASRIHISWNSNGYRMPQLGWSPEHQDSAMLHHCFSTFIGFQ